MIQNNILCMMEIHYEKRFNDYDIFKTTYLFTDIISYVIMHNGFSAHGETLKEAFADITFKIMSQKDVSEHVQRIKDNGYVTPMDYRLVTGACHQGTDLFLKEKHLTWDDRLSISDVKDLVSGKYGSDKFLELFK